MALSSDDRGVLVKCPSCGQTNRQGYQHLNRTIRCANCKANLPAPAAPVDVASAAAFDALVKQSPVPVLVDFWAPWCGPCRMMAPEVEKAAALLEPAVRLVKVNVDEEPALATRFRVQSIPTLALGFEDRELARAAGA